jgi:DNA-binding transcriptional LysR family regulator
MCTGPVRTCTVVFDWNDLRYFLAISRAGTLAGAARELGVEHTTVGRRLTALEQTLGVKLFTRGPNGFVATREAEDVLPLAQEIADRIDRIERRAARGDEKIEGIVKLTTSEALSGYFVKRLGALREKYPSLLVEVLSGNRPYDLMRGEADLAVRIHTATEPDLIARKVVTTNWTMYACKAYVERKGTPVSPEELAGHDIIAYDASLAAVPGAAWLETHAKGANIAFRANSIISALNAAIVGMGLAVLPCFLGDDEPTLVRLTDRFLGSREVMLVVHPDLSKVARVRAVMDFIIATFEKEAPLWRGEGRPAMMEKS